MNYCLEKFCLGQGQSVLGGIFYDALNTIVVLYREEELH
jgi:hypothetical protein